MTPDLWILLCLALLTELLTIPPLIARSTAPGGVRWIFYNRDSLLEGVPPWGERAVRAHGNLADNLAMYVAVIGMAYVTDATNETTMVAGAVLLVARFLHAVVYIAGIPYIRTAVFATAQVAMLVYVWQIIAHFMDQ